MLKKEENGSDRPTAETQVASALHPLLWNQQIWRADHTRPLYTRDFEHVKIWVSRGTLRPICITHLLVKKGSYKQLHPQV